MLVFMLSFVHTHFPPFFLLPHTTQDAIKDAVNILPVITKTQLPIPLVVIEVMDDQANDNDNSNNDNNNNNNRVNTVRKKTKHEIADALELWSIKKGHPDVQWLCSSVKEGSGDDLMSVLQWVGSLYNSFLTIRTD